MVRLFRAIGPKAWLLFLLALGVAVLLTSTAASSLFAQSPVANFPGILRGVTQEGFRYMSGGVGLDEREIMESWGAGYNVKLAFAELSGHYLSGVKVIVEDQNGKEVVNMTSNGPWLYGQLTPGTYTVKATFEGETRQIRNLHLSKGDRVFRTLHWDLD